MKVGDLVIMKDPEDKKFGLGLGIVLSFHTHADYQDTAKVAWNGIKSVRWVGSRWLEVINASR